MADVLSSQNMSQLLIPALLILAGTAAVWRLLTSSKGAQFSKHLNELKSGTDGSNAPRTVLKPDTFQEFPLKVKNVTSHNTAMCVKPCMPALETHC